MGKFDIREAQSTIYVEPLQRWIDLEAAAERVGKGVRCDRLLPRLYGREEYGQHFENNGGLPARPAGTISSFKVESKRSDKHFPLKSPEISAAVGEYLLQQFPNLHVDVHNPDLKVRVEVRRFRRLYPWEGAARGRRHSCRDGR